MGTVANPGTGSSPPASVGGPWRARCEVFSSRRLGRYHSLTLVAPDMAKHTRPGQFVSIAVEGIDTLLRRPFSVYSVSHHGPWAGTVEVVFDVVGEGTRWLAGRAKHDIVDLVGPLGRPFPVPQQPVNCLLVGGGYGAAPLLYLARVLQSQQLRVDMIMGASTQTRLFNAIEAKRLAASAVFTTDDGSFGTRGRVTDVLPGVVDSAGIGVIYACGPMPMLEAVSRQAAQLGVPCQVAVEEAMACGVGVCWTCVVPVRQRDSVANLRACVDGPVFNGARIDWDALAASAAVSPTATDEELSP